jgi:hypothetical protein
MSSKLLWLAVTLIISTTFDPLASRADDATYLLVYKFNSGQFLHYELSDRAELTTQTANNLTRAIQETQCLKSYRIVSVDESGNATLEPVVEHVRMASTTGEKAIVGYDSTKDEVVPRGFENLAGTIGRPLARFQFAPNGRLIKVTLLVDDVPKSFSEAAERTDPAINFLVVFPEQAVKVGEKWSEKFDTKVTVASVGSQVQRELGLIRVFELVKVEDEIATIQFRTSPRIPINEPDILRQIVQQTPSGTIEFDLKNGRLLLRSLKIDEKVIGAFGAQTLLDAQGAMTERLITPKTTAKASGESTDSQKN